MVAKTLRGKHCEQEVIRIYERLHANYGEMFGHISRWKIYEMISIETGYSENRIGIICRSYIKGKIKREN